MTTIAAIKSDTRFLGVPRNKTGLFAADTIHEVKPTRNHLVNVPTLSPQFRNNGSTNVLFASSEQNHHQLLQYNSSKTEIQQYYPLDGGNGATVDSSNDSRLTINGIRNGFRPSTVRHPNYRLTTATTQRHTNHHENKDSPPKSAFSQSRASAKLKSEIDHINNQLKRYGESIKSVHPPNSGEIDGNSHSALSCSTSCRLSSASSTVTADRIHRRFTSAMTNLPTNRRVFMPTMNDISNQNSQVPFGIAGPSPPLIPEADDDQQITIEYQPTHAYQIPQQSNVGSESIFLTDPPKLSSIKTHSAKNIRHHKDIKGVSCPYYVIYFTNLAIHQRDGKDNNNGHDATPAIRKVPVNSRTSTANPKRTTTRRQVNSPISLNTCSTIDDDGDHMTNSTTFPNNKRLSSKIPPTDNENSHTLKDILRTSSWNHVPV